MSRSLVVIEDFSICTRVVIHERDEVPMIDNAGINVEPNRATDIAIEHVSDK